MGSLVERYYKGRPRFKKLPIFFVVFFSTSFLSGCGGGGGGSSPANATTEVDHASRVTAAATEPTTPSPSALTPSADSEANQSPIGSNDICDYPLAEKALASGDSSETTQGELIALIRCALNSIAEQQTLTQTEIYRNADGSIVGDISWDPSSFSGVFSLLDVSRNTPLLVSNYNYKSHTGLPQNLAVAGKMPNAGRYLAISANPMHDLERVGDRPGGDANSQLNALLKNAVGWLLQPNGKSAPQNVAIAHIPETYQFNQDGTTAHWVQNNYPEANIFTEDSCDNQALESCLQSADLLILGRQSNRIADEETQGTTEPRAITASVKSFLDNGGAVIYLHFDGKSNALSEELLALFGLSLQDNFHQQAGLLNAQLADASSDEYLNQWQPLLQTISGQTPLQTTDYSACITANKGNPAINQSWPSCGQREFTSKLSNGLFALRNALANFDNNARPLFDTDGYRLLKLFVLLADKVRTAESSNDESTPAIAYPISAEQPATLAQAAFTDAATVYLRKHNPAQHQLGTLYCSRETLNSGDCPNGQQRQRDLLAETSTAAENGSNATITETISVNISDQAAWHSTGLFALPGTEIHIERSDALSATANFQLFFQSQDATPSLTGGYDRPQWPKSNTIILRNNEKISVSSPYGGPIYILTEGNLSDKGKQATFTISASARHPYLTDIFDDEALDSFLESLEFSSIPWVDIESKGLQSHLRKDKLNANTPLELQQTSGGQALLLNYNGNTRALLEDYREHLLASNFQLAGLPLTQDKPLREMAFQFCANNNWDCENTDIHQVENKLHAIHDERAGCAGNCDSSPWQSGDSLNPLDWNAGHALGHSLYNRLLSVHWSSNSERWNHYFDRSEEAISNIFPYHQVWSFFRNQNADNREIKDPTVNYKDAFAVIQSGFSQLHDEQGPIFFDSSCNIIKNIKGQRPSSISEAIWESNGTYWAMDQRMAFYLQIPMLLEGQQLSDGQTLVSGFDIFSLLFLQARQFQYHANIERSWEQNKHSLGFGAFPHFGEEVYTGRSVKSMPGNDFLLVALSYITGLDFRPYFEQFGVVTSLLAQNQVQQHQKSGHIRGSFSTVNNGVKMAVLNTELPPKTLSSLPTVTLDGHSGWPKDGWHPSNCLN